MYNCMIYMWFKAMLLYKVKKWSCKFIILKVLQSCIVLPCFVVNKGMLKIIIITLVILVCNSHIKYDSDV